MEIRTVTLADLNAVTAMEETCFPPEEAATRRQLMARTAAFRSHFWVMEEKGTTIAFLDGMVTNERTIQDEMYADATLHNEQGNWQTVFGLGTLPEYRHKGYASQLMEHVIHEARSQGRKGCILTCKEDMIPYYEKFGYRNCGISQSVHGGAVWYDLCLEF